MIFYKVKKTNKANKKFNVFDATKSSNMKRGRGLKTRNEEISHLF